MAGCRSTKKIQTVIATKDSVAVTAGNSRADSLAFMRDLYGKIRGTHINFNTFSAKVKVDFEGSDGKKSDFNAFIRLHKDSLLWVSINAALGIEAFRVLITPDSVKVLNKLDKIAQLRSVSYLQEVTKIPLSFNDLQKLIIGNPLYLDSNIVSYKQDGEVVSLISIGELFKHLLTVKTSDYKPDHSKLDDVDNIRARTADISYDKYENKNGIRFSTLRKITVSEKSKLDLELDFKQYDFNEVLNFPFNIPRNYKLQ
jgi:hypothetical protein